MTDVKKIDPRELILEAYRIEGIKEGECRSIFLDWALGVPVDADTTAQIAQLLDVYGTDNPDHPMTAVLRAGLSAPATARRRGRRRARHE